MPLKHRIRLQLALIALLFIALIGTAVQQQWLYGVEARLSDTMLRLDAQRRPVDENIVIIAIDQNSLDDPRMLELAGNWPWPRAVHGELLAHLAAQQPAAVVFDLIFSEPDVFRPGSDALFTQAIRDAAATLPVYLPLVVAADGAGTALNTLPARMGVAATAQAQDTARLPLIAPKALDSAVWNTGLINFLADADGVGRRYWLRYPHEGWTLASMPYRVAQDQGWPLPTDAALGLRWHQREFPRISYRDLYLDAQKQQPQGRPELRGKIVIVAAMAPGLGDLRPTPLAGITPGADILATAMANLKAGNNLRPLAGGWAFALGLVLVCGLAALQQFGMAPLRLALVLAAFTLLTIAGTWLLLQSDRLWHPYTALIGGWAFFLAATLRLHLHERQAREHAIGMFGRFLDPRVVRTIVETDQIAAAEVGRSQEISVLFSDIRGFTTLSERSEPAEVVRLLNRYFDLQVQAVFKHDGTLDKFIGDAIMAFWGAPIEQADHAVKAVEAALDMQERLRQFQVELGERGALFDVGIGIHTGPAVVGFLGSSQRLDFTAIGDTVNLASRIEGLTKGVARILVSEATRRRCEQAGARFVFIDHGEFSVKGRDEPVRLFEPKVQ